MARLSLMEGRFPNITPPELCWYGPLLVVRERSFKFQLFSIPGSANDEHVSSPIFEYLLHFPEALLHLRRLAYGSVAVLHMNLGQVAARHRDLRVSFKSEIDARVFEVLLSVCLRWTQVFLKEWSGSDHPGIQYSMPSSPGRLSRIRLYRSGPFPNTHSLSDHLVNS